MLGPTSRNCPNGCGLDFMLRRTAKFGYVRYRENLGTRVSVEFGYVRYRKIWGPITRFRRPGSETRFKNQIFGKPFGFTGSRDHVGPSGRLSDPDSFDITEKNLKRRRQREDESDRQSCSSGISMPLSGEGWGALLPKTVPMVWGRSFRRFQREASAVQSDSELEMESPIPVSLLESVFERERRPTIE